MDDTFPQDVELIPNHIGAIGEALLNAEHNVPDSIEVVLSRHAAGECPFEAEPQDAFVVATEIEPHTIYSTEIDEDSVKWVPDLYFEVAIGVADNDWRKKYPVEIKTEEGSLVKNQRKVIQFLGQHTEYQPVIVSLKLDRLPEYYTISELEIV